MRASIIVIINTIIITKMAQSTHQVQSASGGSIEGWNHECVHRGGFTSRSPRHRSLSRQFIPWWFLSLSLDSPVALLVPGLPLD